MTIVLLPQKQESLAIVRGDGGSDSSRVFHLDDQSQSQLGPAGLRFLVSAVCRHGTAKVVHMNSLIVISTRLLKSSAKKIALLPLKP